MKYSARYLCICIAYNKLFSGKNIPSAVPGFISIVAVDCAVVVNTIAVTGCMTLHGPSVPGSPQSLARAEYKTGPIQELGYMTLPGPYEVTVQEVS